MEASPARAGQNEYVVPAGSRYAYVAVRGCAGPPGGEEVPPSLVQVALDTVDDLGERAGRRPHLLARTSMS